MTIETRSRNEDPINYLKVMASNIDLYIRFWGRKAIPEISVICGLWEIKADYPEAEELKGRKKDKRLLNIFYKEIAENGTQIPHGWKRNILKRYRKRHTNP